MYKLLIVESPNKEKTIQKYLGEEYKVMASNGHILKLSVSGQGQLGINLETWEPKYNIETNKKAIVKKLKEAAKKASEVLIATDPDREGEAIAQNLVDYLDIADKYKRVRYNEITKTAIQEAIANPQEIDNDLVAAQKARRMLDRIIGFKLSKLMKQTTKNAPTIPSAGRVQSIALKLVCDKEKEIEAFIPVKYETVQAKIDGDITADCYLKPSVLEKNTWLTPEIASSVLDNKTNTLEVKDFKVSQRRDSEITPFKQSVLYKEAKYSSKIVQEAAQKLFEYGLITYPRTDSTRMSQRFIETAKEFVANKYGKEFVAENVKGFSGQQDAHEAIRPTSLDLSPQQARAEHNLSAQHAYIYELIYNKTLMSIMKPPVREFYQYDLADGGYGYKMSFSKIIFDGYSLVKKAEEDSKKIPVYEIGQKIPVFKYIHEKKQTQPPARYTEGSLIQMLDEIKVGRPSTFATTISVIKKRLFVERQKNSLVPTEFGKVINEKLVENFKEIINEEYTSEVEAELDKIAEGDLDFRKVMDDFWTDFQRVFETASQNMTVSSLDKQYVNEKCPNCDRELLYRYNKSNKQRFIGCEGFPSCKFVKPDPDAKPRTWYRKKVAKNEETN
ncbi:type I DNA topoisomerase [[Mycoplasma] gypis]|uniref:DNA topoisomerase 1 n=1 Tax=[Mycoplasma] gypis TaxID=92404 RepID=A0ABZ2RQY8_9BACT|nr:type I DNA topoisomerase [[Mycoplasma] gypis]MBN0919360.1 type I DNA topoisomerase [[Mycoplasma] gypis]